MGPVGRVPPTFKDVGTKIIWSPQLLQLAFCCTRLIVTNDQTNVFSCNRFSLILETHYSALCVVASLIER